MDDFNVVSKEGGSTWGSRFRTSNRESLKIF
jgi:hypothetical protein